MDETLKRLLKGSIAKLAGKLPKYTEFFYIEVEGQSRPCIRVADQILIAWHPRPKNV